MPIRTYYQTRIHYQTEIRVDINKDIIKETKSLITDTLEKVWLDTYLADLDIKEYIDAAVDIWTKYYVDSRDTRDSINKIKSANPPPGLRTYIVFNLFDDSDTLIIDYLEISKTPLFRSYLPTGDLWNTYIYDQGKFVSLEIIEPAYVEEMKEGMTQQQIMDLDETILQSYGFHNRLLGITAKKIRLYTTQPQGRIEEWNNRGIIPKGMYFTDNIARTEYYWEEGDIIVDYRIPEDKIVETSEFGGAKEYVTIEDVIIK